MAFNGFTIQWQTWLKTIIHQITTCLLGSKMQSDGTNYIEGDGLSSGEAFTTNIPRGGRHGLRKKGTEAFGLKNMVAN
jgi:hypothetical protein